MLIDSSAWIEFLRATGSPTQHAVRDLIAADAQLESCDPVELEILAGARSDSHAVQLRALLARTHRVRTTEADWESAAQLYRVGRSRGVTVRKLMDCLIATIAIRADVPVLHDDVDFDAIASFTDLDARRA